ncbi:LuxR C-terminal-related transcriptional regulator [Nocardia sp. NPDC059177]|uniref:LuxR C-terminal-related transcriptional regulator n=1 Tax=Nocardia sp. NPDC059177 TaxID=3346759 RepID=UPI0036A88F75
MVKRGITVVVIDDRRLLRTALCESLRVERDIEVVGDAGSGDIGVEIVRSMSPDVVVLDVDIPGEGIAMTLRQIRRSSPESKVLIVTMHRGVEIVRELFRLGISGYVHSSACRDDLIVAIRTAARSDLSFVLIPRQPSAPVDDEPDSGEGTLTARELEVLRYVQQAMSNRQISRNLKIAEGTVKRHLRNIFAKLDAESRIDAVNRAVSAGLLLSSQAATPVPERQGARR